MVIYRCSFGALNHTFLSGVVQNRTSCPSVLRISDLTRGKHLGCGVVYGTLCETRQQVKSGYCFGNNQSNLWPLLYNHHNHNHLWCCCMWLIYVLLSWQWKKYSWAYINKVYKQKILRSFLIIISVDLQVFFAVLILQVFWGGVGLRFIKEKCPRHQRSQCKRD